MISWSTEKDEQCWYDYKKNPPELGEEVIAYSSKWIDKISNKNGIRIGWRDESKSYGTNNEFGNSFLSAYYDDRYLTVDKLMTNDFHEYDYLAPEIREELKATSEPEYWMPLPKFNIDKVREKDETDYI